MLLKEKIREATDKVITEKFGVNIDNIDVTYPDNPSFGDYTTTVAFRVSKLLKDKGYKLPDISSKIVEGLKEKLKEEFSEINFLNGGFINLKLSKEYLSKLTEEISENEEYGKSGFGKGKGKILLEYVSANPTGPLHIGHARWASIGDSLYRAFITSGYDIKSEFYINDAGNQITLLRESVEAVRQGKEIPENGYHGEYIYELAKTKEDPVKVILEWQKEDLALFDVHFDNWFSEKSLHDSGYVDDTFNLLKEKGLIYEKDSAWWFKSTLFGDNKDRVVKRSNGEYTYFGVDIAYHRNKIERGFDRLINIWGADHHGYVKRLESAISSINTDVKFEVVIGQMVSLYRNGEPVRMSKRTGDIITLREVLDEVGKDVLRYYLVSKKVDTHIDFDIEEAKKQSEDNPVYYLQYAHARISGILRNSQGIPEIEGSKDIIDTPESEEIARKLAKFPEEIVDIALSLEPQRMTTYLLDLASLFHKFYSKHRVIDNEKVHKGRRILVKAIKNVLKKGLWIIGVNAPEVM